MRISFRFEFVELPFWGDRGGFCARVVVGVIFLRRRPNVIAKAPSSLSGLEVLSGVLGLATLAESKQNSHIPLAKIYPNKASEQSTLIQNSGVDILGSCTE